MYLTDPNTFEREHFDGLHTQCHLRRQVDAVAADGISIGQARYAALGIVDLEARQG